MNAENERDMVVGELTAALDNLQTGDTDKPAMSLEVQPADTGRKDGLAAYPIISIIGGLHSIIEASATSICSLVYDIKL